MGPSANETWLVEAGDAIIQKKAHSGFENLLPWEALVYCVWVADYGMRNAGDLETAADVYDEFQLHARRLAEQLALRVTQETFSLSMADLENQYFERFEPMCEEIRRYQSAAGG